MTGHKLVAEFLATHATLGAQFAQRIGLDHTVQAAIGQTYEQWDGKGYPCRLRGEQITLPTRLAHLASPVEIFSRQRGQALLEGRASRSRPMSGPLDTASDMPTQSLACDVNQLVTPGAEWGGGR